MIWHRPNLIGRLQSFWQRHLVGYKSEASRERSAGIRGSPVSPFIFLTSLVVDVLIALLP
jgi:hypothetical protein